MTSLPFSEVLCVFRILKSDKLYDFLIRSLEAVEDTINSNFAYKGKYFNYIQLYTKKKKKKIKREIVHISSNNKYLMIYL